MRSSFSILAGLLVMGASALAQPRRSVTARRSPVAAPARDATPPDTARVLVDDAGAPARPAPTCCCRAWSHGWQYAWRAETECAAQNGTCVSPDHC